MICLGRFACFFGSTYDEKCIIHKHTINKGKIEKMITILYPGFLSVQTKWSCFFLAGRRLNVTGNLFFGFQIGLYFRFINNFPINHVYRKLSFSI